MLSKRQVTWIRERYAAGALLVPMARRLGQSVTVVVAAAIGQTHRDLPGACLPRRGDRAPCSFPECGRRVSSLGLCLTHYTQENKGQALRPIQRRQSRLDEDGELLKCEEPGCARPVAESGLCQAHVSKEQRRRWASDTTGPQCCESGCGRRAIVKGQCHQHYLRDWKRRKRRAQGLKERTVRRG